jgi:asparagine synthase (glutamine-hydrolysing)
MSRAAGSKMKSFSIVFDEQGFSEDKEACETAAFIGTDHHSFRLTGGQIANDLPRILAAMDQPTGDGINTYYASQAARAGGVTVALSGLGGDELFGGYPSFRDLPRIHPWLRCWSLLPEFLRSTVTSRLNKGDTRRRKLADFLTYARNLNELGALQRRVFSEAGQRSLLSPDLLGPSVDLSPFHPQLDQLSADLVGSPDFEVLSAWELRTYMADVLLRDSDVMSMQHSLELRVPFIDRPFVEWLWSQPVSWKYDRSSPKSPLAAAVSDLLPPALLTRKKRGFSLPFPVWMKSTLRPFLQETFSTSSLAQSGLFHISNTQDRWNGFLKSDDQREWSRLWSLAVLIHFVNRRP